MVEFAIVAVLLFTLIFGIVIYGYVMSFRGSMQQSASEGARAAAPAPRPLTSISPSTPGGRDNTLAYARARAAVDRAIAGYDRTCNNGALSCDYQIHDCNKTSSAADPDTPNIPDCITVSLEYDNRLDPIPASIPLIARITPASLSVTSTIQLNDQ